MVEREGRRCTNWVLGFLHGYFHHHISIEYGGRTKHLVCVCVWVCWGGCVCDVLGGEGGEEEKWES